MGRAVCRRIDNQPGGMGGDSGWIDDGMDVYERFGGWLDIVYAERAIKYAVAASLRV